MSIDIGIAVINRLEFLKKIIKSLEETLSEKRNTIILDNGSKVDDIKGYAESIGANFIRNESNEGIYKGYNQIYKSSKADFVAFLHNDICIFEKDWDKRVLATINDIEKKFKRKVGIIGFAGSRGAGREGARVGFMSNLKEWEGSHSAEVHGRRITDYKPATFLDGSVLICRRELLDKIGGFDEGYKCHHIYDYDISLSSLRARYVNAVVGIEFAHRGGITAISDWAILSFSEWCEKDETLKKYFADNMQYNPKLTQEQAIIDFNTQRFFKKWAGFIPCFMNDNFHLIKGRSH